jgi:hypothetical protein
MSRAGGDPILTTRVDITGNVAPLQQAVTQAKAESKKAGEEIQANLSKPAAAAVAMSASGVRGAAGSTSGVPGYRTGYVSPEIVPIRNITPAANDASKAVKGLDQELRTAFSRVIGGAGAVGALMAATDRAVGSYKAFTQAAADSVTEIEKLRNAITGGTPFDAALNDYEKAVKRIGEAAIEARKQLANDETASGIADLLQRTLVGIQLTEGSALNLAEAYRAGTAALIDQKAEIIDNAERTGRNNLKAANDEKQAVERVEKIKQLREQLNKLQLDGLSGIERINAETDAAIQANAAAQSKASGDELKLLQAISAQILRNADLRTAELYERQRKEKEAADKQAAEEQKRIDKQAKALADAYSGAFDRIRAESANAFPAERLIGSIETMIERLEALADQRSRLRG